jgi:DNA repair photolyase
MNPVIYREEPCKGALNRCTGMPFRWTLNPYMGCVHRCAYCYVRAYEKRADRPSDDMYGRSIRVKTNVAQVLGWELHRGNGPLPACRGPVQAHSRLPAGPGGGSQPLRPDHARAHDHP